LLILENHSKKIDELNQSGLRDASQQSAATAFSAPSPMLGNLLPCGGDMD